MIAGRVSWSAEAEGHRYQTEWVWVPIAEPGRFLLVCLVSFGVDWEGDRRGLEAVLASRELGEREEEPKSWLGKLWQKWRQ